MLKQRSYAVNRICIQHNYRHRPGARRNTNTSRGNRHHNFCGAYYRPFSNCSTNTKQSKKGLPPTSVAVPFLQAHVRYVQSCCNLERSGCYVLSHTHFMGGYQYFAPPQYKGVPILHYRHNAITQGYFTRDYRNRLTICHAPQPANIRCWLPIKCAQHRNHSLVNIRVGCTMHRVTGLSAQQFCLKQSNLTGRPRCRIVHSRHINAEKRRLL